MQPGPKPYPAVVTFSGAAVGTHMTSIPRPGESRVAIRQHDTQSVGHHGRDSAATPTG